ncbi:MAG TPA: hypothetical protein VFD80_03985, partial [Flavobacteriaceae bacterium]|nr:hypothetical protein [Flavobacteriaceae bacterium]
IAKGHISSSINVETEDFVIYDNESWEELYETLTPYSGQTIDFEETEIDFDAYQILASFDEVRPYPGWVIDIESVIEKTNQIDVLVKVYQDYIGLTPWSTRQIHIVKIPKSDKPVVFERIYPEGS